MIRNVMAFVVLVALVVWGVLDYQGANKSSANGVVDAEQGDFTQNFGKPGVQTGNTALDFTLSTPEGKEVKLSDFRGKKVILNFWASWCPPCREEMPQLEKFYKDYKSKNVILLGVNLTHTEKTVDNAVDFIHKQGLTYPNVLDRQGQVSDNYNLVAYPTTLVIDSDGVIRAKYVGEINYDTLKKAVSRLP